MGRRSLEREHDLGPQRQFLTQDCWNPVWETLCRWTGEHAKRELFVGFESVSSPVAHSSPVQRDSRLETWSWAISYHNRKSLSGLDSGGTRSETPESLRRASPTVVVPSLTALSCSARWRREGAV